MKNEMRFYMEINEIFTSFQGEGVHTGLPTTFIRLAGCNLDCKWCDTRYALSPSSGIETDIDEVFSKVKEPGIRMICITGGEPLIQPGTIELVKILAKEGYSIDIETNGSLSIESYVNLGHKVMISMDVKTPSSGEQDSFLNENITFLRPTDQLKFILSNETDLDFAIEFIKRERPSCNLVLTPVSNRGGDLLADKIMDVTLNGILPADRIRLMVQTHKVIWGGERRGV